MFVTILINLRILFLNGKPDGEGRHLHQGHQPPVSCREDHPLENLRLALLEGGVLRSDGRAAGRQGNGAEIDRGRVWREREAVAVFVSDSEDAADSAGERYILFRGIHYFFKHTILFLDKLGVCQFFVGSSQNDPTPEYRREYSGICPESSFNHASKYVIYNATCIE